MPELVLLRHGQSLWNAENLFTGWYDVDLTALGEAEAARSRTAAGRSDADLDLRVVHTSLLTRAIRTADLTLDGRRADAGSRSAATGGSTSATTAPCRAEQEGDHRPARRGPGQGVAPELRHPAPAGRARAPPTTRPATPATATCRPTPCPLTECLADVVARVVPYWDDAIVPDLLAEGPRGGAVLVVAHGNSLRALRKHIDGHRRRRDRGPRDPDRHPLPLPLADDLSVVSSGYLGDPDGGRGGGRGRSPPSRLTRRPTGRPVRLTPALVRPRQVGPVPTDRHLGHSRRAVRQPDGRLCA